MDSIAKDLAYMNYETKRIQRLTNELGRASMPDMVVNEIHDSALSVVDSANSAILTLVALRSKVKQFLKRL